MLYDCYNHDSFLFLLHDNLLVHWDSKCTYKNFTIIIIHIDIEELEEDEKEKKVHVHVHVIYKNNVW